MILVSCPNCGSELRIPDRFRGQKGRCQYCNQYISVPDSTIAPQCAPDEESNQPVGPEHFGHYRKAPDEDWEDPYDEGQGEVALDGIPDEILAKHRALLARKRKRAILLGVAAGLLITAAILAAILVYEMARDNGTPAAPSTTGTPPAAAAPASAPAVTAAPAAADATPPQATATPLRVYSVQSDPHYHRADCAVYLSGAGQRYEGTVEQASAAGFQTQCPLCKPGVAISGAASPQPVPGTPVTTAPAPVEDATVVYVTPTGDHYHAHGCALMQGASNAISLDDARARGYQPCSRCLRPAVP
ncbi:MAG: hypothetical protein KA184_01910 [Candidatus Hydrogenedentes bacterium]|nr:hypothetical protein [Candidatus Hydrogenedentota bacterium]